MKNLGISFRPDKKSSEALAEADKAERMRGVMEDIEFRKEIEKLVSMTRSEFLKGIVIGKLTKEDQYFYLLFKRHELTPELVLKQLEILNGFPEAASSKKLLYYMLYQLQEEEKKEIKKRV